MQRSSSSRKGFTVIELVLFSAIFALISVSFLSVLVAVVKVQTRQGASNDVNQQSNFALATIQRLVEQSSYIDGTAGVASSGVSLRMASSTIDPTLLYVASSSLWLKQGSAPASQLLTSGVSVSNASFVKRSNAGGKDALGVNLTINNATASSTQQVARILNVFVSRVSAATFDADVLPSGNYKLGASGSVWQNINDIIYFASGKVGIGSGASSPASKLDIDGGVRVNAANTTRPSCESSIRGTLWVSQPGGSATDTVEACLRNAGGSYVWMTL